MKKVISILLILVMLVGLVAPAGAMEVEGEAETIYVYVVFNALGEGYIQDMLLEDGTRVGDHDYVIIYADNYIENTEYNPRMRTFQARISRYFDLVTWVTRSDVLSLRLQPTNVVRDTRAGADRGWAILRCNTEGIGRDSRWGSNINVMWQQYICHYWFANRQTQWHLEPHRTSLLGLPQTIFFACNP